MEGLEYNGKQWKSFGHELVLGKLGDQPDTFHHGSPICLDGGRLGRFFFQFFFAEKIDFFWGHFSIVFCRGVWSHWESFVSQYSSVLSRSRRFWYEVCFSRWDMRNPRPGERKTCFPCQVTKRACFTRGQRWKRTCAVRRGGFRYDIQIEVSCSFFLI